MDLRDRILGAARALTLDRGVVPSLNDVAAAAGVSKGGLVHHFPSRAALVAGLARVALDEIDAAMVEAADRGRAVDTWLRLSVPGDDDVALFRAMAIAHRSVEAPGDDVALAAAAALERWEAMIRHEVGDPSLARVIRLLGDGIAANVVAGIERPPTTAELDALLAAVMPPPENAPVR